MGKEKMESEKRGVGGGYTMIDWVDGLVGGGDGEMGMVCFCAWWFGWLAYSLGYERKEASWRHSGVGRYWWGEMVGWLKRVWGRGEKSATT